MASTLTVKVHPVVYLTIVDAFERRSNKPGANDKALGTLMGFYEKMPSSNKLLCHTVPRAKEDTPELDDGFNQTMLMMMKRATPSEQPVGCQKEPPPVILLTVDTTFNSPNENYRMPVRAYLRIKAGIPGTRDPHCAIFNPLKVEFDAFPGESVALSLVQVGTACNNKQREIILESGLEQLEKVRVLEKPELPVDSSFGRRMMDIVSIAATHMSNEKLDVLVKTSLRDYMMISYLASLTKTQLSLQERLVAL
ncbi:Eukaryotic translation initiation factor 3 subunit F [Dirofilaria immitis]|nr:Eukaryotic translation initiation factor 3 subunit F [Dirofilaria immitis]